MSDAEGEIEYLDEDADIVQQFVENHGQSFKSKVTENGDDEHVQSAEDAKEIAIAKASVDITKRRKLGITLPDFSDPLCMPVNAYRTSEIDKRRITNWNNLCLDRLKCSDQVLKLDEGVTKSSKRTVVLKKIKQRPTVSSESEISMWNKTTVENDKGAKKSEIFQCTLPKYREKKTLDFKMCSGYKKKPDSHGKEMVLLCREGHDEDERLVAYNTMQGTVAIYKLKETEDGGSIKKHAWEVTCSKICAPCYQVSYRRTSADNGKEITCPICKRTSVSANNLLKHLKSHSDYDIRKYKNTVSRVLASVMPYHYKCRICQEQFMTVKSLRKHVARHKSNELFMCEVGNHIAS